MRSVNCVRLFVRSSLEYKRPLVSVRLLVCIKQTPNMRALLLACAKSTQAIKVTALCRPASEAEECERVSMIHANELSCELSLLL